MKSIFIMAILMPSMQRKGTKTESVKRAVHTTLLIPFALSDVVTRGGLRPLRHSYEQDEYCRRSQFFVPLLILLPNSRNPCCRRGMSYEKAGYPGISV